MNFSNTSSEPRSCTPLGWNASLQNDRRHDLISSEVLLLLDRIKCVIVIPILFIVGAPTNIISLAVFSKQGLAERINLCLFLLAGTDLSFLTFIFTYRFTQTGAQFASSGEFGPMHVYMTNENVIGLNGLVYVSMFISSVISVERCVCVLLPLQAQRCVQTKSFAVVLIFSAGLVGFSRFVVTAKYLAVCFHETGTGRKSWGYTVTDFYLQNKGIIDVLDGTFYGFCLSLGCPLVVLVTTVITAVKLQQVIRWRDRASSTMSGKEIGVTKMLICLSVEFLVLFIPFLFIRILPMFGTEVKVNGLYENMFMTLVSIAEVCTCISSSVNFFVYYFTGSRYRETFHQLLCWRSSSK